VRSSSSATATGTRVGKKGAGGGGAGAKSLSHMGAYVQYDSSLTVAHLPGFSTPSRVPNWQFHPLWDSH